MPVEEDNTMTLEDFLSKKHSTRIGEAFEGTKEDSEESPSVPVVGSKEEEAFVSVSYATCSQGSL